MSEETPLLVTNTVVAGRYRILRMLGSGMMGQVYEAEDQTTGTSVALKMLRPNLNAEDETVARFLKEPKAASAAARNSDHVIRVLDAGSDTKLGFHFLTMEFLVGHNLYEEMERFGGKLPPIHAVEVALQVLDGLEAAHEATVIHRDLKPENIFVARGRKHSTLMAKILDFGIAQVVAPGKDRMTRTATLMGTAYYMSPEQHQRPKEVDRRADIYSLGVILWEMLMGRPPFEGETFVATLMMAAREEPPPMEGIESDLQKVVLTAMAKRPNERFQSAAAFAQALERYAIANHEFTRIGVREFSLPEKAARLLPPVGADEPTEVLDLVSNTTPPPEGAILAHQSGTFAGVGEVTVKPPLPVNVKLQRLGGGDPGQESPVRQAQTNLSGTFDKRPTARSPRPTIIIAFAAVTLAAIIGVLIMRGVANTPRPTPHTTRDARPEPTPLEPTPPVPAPTPPRAEPTPPVATTPQEPPPPVAQPSGRNRRTPRGQPRPPHSRRHRCHPDPDDPDGPQICD